MTYDFSFWREANGYVIRGVLPGEKDVPKVPYECRKLEDLYRDDPSSDAYWKHYGYEPTTLLES